MASSHSYIAADIGAESGRVMLASLDGDHLSLREVHRFTNGPVRLNDGIHWDVLRLWGEIKAGISSAAGSGVRPESLGLDTWGVDFALLDNRATLLSNPFHYRDERTDGMLDEAFRRMPRSQIFANTGIQFMPINTLYQLLSLVVQKSSVLEIADTLLTIPDLFNYWLSGQMTNEFTNATTTQCLDPRTRRWAVSVFDALGIPSRIFGSITESGTPIGPLLPSIAEETGARGLQIVVPACHDTGSAVVAIPARNQDFVWISSGTWSIMGAEVATPCLDENALSSNFTNEGGVCGTWRLSKNIMGLWLVQECRRVWSQQGEELSYDVLTSLASQARPFLAVIDPDRSEFLHPGDIPARIRAFCRNTGQAEPQTKGEVVRVALESLALKYRWVLERLEDLMGKQFAPLHIIGGGTRNRLLNQFTADATHRVVFAGPVEATAIGNALMQAMGLGHLGSLADVRAVVRTSFRVDEYQPVSSDRWEPSYQKLLGLL